MTNYRNALSLIAIAAFSLSAFAERVPNILLIMADDMGWSDLGCYGNDLIDTPHIDKLAAEGMRFTNAYAMPVCTPTRVSIQSGKNTATLQIQHPNPHNRPHGKLITPPQYWRLPLDETTIGEQFDLSSELPSTTQLLKEKLDTWLASVSAAIPEPNPYFNPNLEEQWGLRDRQNWQEKFALPEND